MRPAAGKPANAVRKAVLPSNRPSGAETRSVEGSPALHQGTDRSHLEIQEISNGGGSWGRWRPERR